MPLRLSHIYLIGEFQLDPAEKTLSHNGIVVPLTPKVFDTLQVLVENAGRLVEKAELMQQIWGDRYVEEGNLSYNVKMLRKALGDRATSPLYIETVPRRGYRFIAAVTPTPRACTTIARDSTAADTTPPVGRRPVRSRVRRFYLALAVALIPVVMASGIWYVKSKSLEGIIPVLYGSFAAQKISTDGTVLNAVISRDGQKVVYTNGIQDKQSVWLRQIDTSNNVQILPPSDYFYYGLALSPDGNILYFTRRTKLIEGQADIYRVSIFGGVPERIVSESQGQISISEDGAHITYVRCYYQADENCSLWIADAADGGNERKLLSRPRPFRIGDITFSRSGRTITFAVGQSENQSNEFSLAEVDITSGKEREISDQRFFNIKSLVGLPDESGFLIAASRVPDRTFRIWRVPAIRGAAEPLTKDGESYATLSLNAAATMLVATQIRQNFNIRIYGAENIADKRVLTDASSVAYSPDGKIIFSSARTGNHEIWSINADGSDQRQLTNNIAEDRMATVSPDSAQIFFESNRSGQSHVWRINADGTNEVQITAEEGGFPISVSPDGRWLYYRSATQKTLRRISTSGGDDQLVLDKRSSTFAISPDGTRAAYTEKLDGTPNIVVISLDDGSTIRTFPLPSGTISSVDLVWTNNGDGLAYIMRNSEWKQNSLWVQPLVAGPARQIGDLGDEIVSDLSGFALSPDGSSFALAMGRWEHNAVLLHGLK